MRRGGDIVYYWYCHFVEVGKKKSECDRIGEEEKNHHQLDKRYSAYLIFNFRGTFVNCQIVRSKFRINSFPNRVQLWRFFISE